MTKVPLNQILQHGLRSASSSWLLTLLVLSGFLFSPASAQVGLPRAAISIPTDGPIATGLQSVEHCATNHNLIVLPPIAFQFGAAEITSNSLAAQAQATKSAPKDSDLWLHAIANGDSLTGKETEKQLTDRVDALLKSIPLASPGVRGLIVEVNEPRTVPDLYAFGLLRLALTAKSINPNSKLAFVFPPGFIDRHGDLVKRLALYADLLGMTYTADWHKDAAWIAEQALNKPVVLKLDSDASATDSSLLAAELAASGISVEVLWSQPTNAMAAVKVCALNSFMQHVIPSNMNRVNSSSAPFKLTVDGKESDEPWWFGSGRSSDLAMVAHINANSNHPKQLTLTGISAAQYEVQWFDPATGIRIPAIEPTGTAPNWTQTLSSTSEYLVISFHKQRGTDSTVYNSVDVNSGVQLSVEEIIARWQKYGEAQKQKLENYVSSSFMNLHFESTNVVSAFDISMQIKRFYDRSGQTELAQTALYVNGVKFNNKYEFPLPQLEPEKVLTPPLELKLNENYAYKLLGTEQINGALCFVVGVEPKVQEVTLYSGKIWIDGTTFREVKQTLSQRGDKSNIVANIETQNYELVADGKGNQFNLLHSISEQQTLNAAGRDFLLQRTILFSGYEINASEFSNSVTAERNSQDPMYRDTDHGLRALKKEGNERVLVEDTKKRISSIVGGAMYEGTFNFPIPIAGLTISDFDYRHTGAQLSTFFAGVLLATDLSKQFGNKYRLSGDLALSAIPGEDRRYTGNTEDTGAEIYAWAESTGVRAAWLATNHLSLTASTYLEYDFFHATSDTSSQYVVPRNGVALLPGLQVRFTDKGYTFTANGTRAQRFAWSQFGCIAAILQPNGCSPPHPLESGYTLYDADVNKDYYFKKFTKGGWDLSYFGGDQQDRFSRYYPSIFSQPNVHGIPSGTDSFDAIAMASVHYGLNVMDIVKIEEMYSYTRARNLEESSHFRKFDGLETRINTPGPFGTLMQSTVSYALDGNIARYNSRWGVLFMIFKPLH
jgi:ribosomal protein L24